MRQLVSRRRRRALALTLVDVHRMTKRDVARLQGQVANGEWLYSPMHGVYFVAALPEDVCGETLADAVRRAEGSVLPRLWQNYTMLQEQRVRTGGLGAGKSAMMATKLLRLIHAQLRKPVKLMEHCQHCKQRECTDCMWAIRYGA